ncbi:acyltransferase family protein [Ancylobacter polymorphus]|uniref:Peptidoglycan/LPS O-acetylase OafA/YrhL n=1 Tax=Ancylobacter polymorphus TaxID=223390 RepID=A0ABU0BIU3_9HYPH|nr:acyltransferase [Ancylobacter polymorphus]MDQ0305216.1 peptidoglycan/LPS O-acetylase OafA/YrhL [Ancylobacter polymorphus]
MWRELTAFPAALQRRRIESIDVLRCVSVLYIVAFWHLGNYISNASYQNAITTHLTVGALALFFLISGYMVSPAKKVSGLESGGTFRFLAERFIRIYPPYLVASIFFLILNLESIGVFIRSVFLISMFAKPAPMTLWFITALIICYCTVPVLAKFRRDTILYVFVCFSFMVSGYLYNFATGRLDVRLLIYFPSFAAGVFMAGRVLSTGAALPIAVGVGTLAALVLSTRSDFTELETDLRATPFALFFASLVFAVTVTRVRAVKFATLFRYVAYASFFMYLGHRIVFLVVKYIYFPEAPAMQIVYMLAAVVFLIFPLSFAAQCGYDNVVGVLNARRCRT